MNKQIQSNVTDDVPNDMKDNEINFAIFSNKMHKCDATDNNIKEEIIKNCSSLYRIAHSLKYYELLSKDDSDKNNKNDVFIEFINTLYPLCLPDYIHLICEHSSTEHLSKINFELLNNYKFDNNKCNSNLSNCKWTQMHFRANRNESNDNNNFYLNLFSTIHFYFFHLEIVGLRFFKSVGLEKPVGTSTVDVYFNAMQKEIEIKRKKYDIFGINNDRLNIEKNSKFNIMNINTNKMEDNDTFIGNNDTFTDSMLVYMSNKNGTNIIKNVEELKTFVTSEEFDSDSIIEDISNQYGNISKTQNNNVYTIKRFIKKYNIGTAQFSTGIAFFYWDWYKTCTEEQFKSKQDRLNHNNFGGYSIQNLFVCKYYYSIKEEALQRGFININLFNTKVVKKSQIYIKSRKCKKIKCVEYDDKLHFGIESNESLKIKHLQSLIIYTDFTDFCTAFSESFRAISWNEDLKYIKIRHEKFYHISKYLNEFICYYGVQSHHKQNSTGENGPFYCGVSCVLNIGSFAIRLNAPTSTSKHLEIATNFSKKNGMIIQINNIANMEAGAKERFMNCSWISGYPEEEERLFIRGRYKLEIESICLVNKKINQWNNYELYLHSFYLFDSLLSGDWPSQSKINKQDIVIISNCISHILGIKENSFDAYVNDAFFLFCQEKTQIILNLYEMDQYIKNKEFISLVMHSIVEEDDQEANHNLDNLFKVDLLNLFENTNEVVIYTTNDPYIYPLNIISLLNIICAASSTFNKIIIKDRYKNWLYTYFMKCSSDIQQKYNAKNLSINLKRKQGKAQNEDWLIISV